MSNRNNSDFHKRTLWTSKQFQDDLNQAAALFRRERMEEPLEEYLEQFDEIQITFENLLEETVDLSFLEENALEILTNPTKLDGFRYLAGPPISMDDLQALAEASLTPKRLRENPELVQRLIRIIRDVMDRRRFPWVAEGREPTPTEREAAVVASAALMATQRVATYRRNNSKLEQEAKVAACMRDLGLAESNAAGGIIKTMHSAPPPGSFCAQETVLGDRKADIVVRLWDGRIMPIECKVSNSALNSVKRLKNDAAVKAETWLKDFGATQVVPVAVLSGLYGLGTLESAQSRGLTIYWAHRLEDLTDWIDESR
jgi:hypothetical protein